MASVSRLLRRAVTGFVLWRARRRVRSAYPELASPIRTRAADGRFAKSNRRDALHARLRQEIRV